MPPDAPVMRAVGEEVGIEDALMPDHLNAYGYGETNITPTTSMEAQARMPVPPLIIVVA